MIPYFSFWCIADEPAFSREPKETVDWGASCVNEAVKGVDLNKVHVQVHVCYGYPDECYNDEVHDMNNANEPNNSSSLTLILVFSDTATIACAVVFEGDC